MSQEQQQENKQKIRIGLIFGGRSEEHEVSLASANSVMANLDKDKYEVIPIGITKTGAWLLGTDPTRLLAAPDAQPNSAQSDQQATTAVTLTGDPNVRRLIPLQNRVKISHNVHPENLKTKEGRNFFFSAIQTHAIRERQGDRVSARGRRCGRHLT